MRPVIAGVICAIVLALIVLPQKENEISRPSNEPSAKHDVIPTATPRHREPVHAIPTLPDTQNRAVTGTASFYTNDYCRKYNPECHTASGEVFDDTKLTTACSSRYPLGSILRVTYEDVVVEVKCNDRGSFEGSYNRILDLSKASFEALAPVSRGVISVTVEIVQ